MAENTLAGFERKLDRMVAEFDGPQARAKLMRVGKLGAQDATGAVKAAIGDLSMSHWTRAKPIDLSFKAKVISGHEVEIAPAKARALGPERVLNDGRQAHTKGDRRLTGKTSKKTGKALSRKVKRSGAATAGKGTWDKGKQLIEQRTPARLHDEVVKVLRNEFRG